MGLKSLNPSVGLSMPKAVVFDLDNTLYPYETAHLAGLAAVCSYCAEKIGLNKIAFADYLQASKDLVKTQLGQTASSHSRLLYFQTLLELIGLQSQPQMALELEGLYWEVFISQIRCFDGVLEWLQIIRHRNIPIALVTDLTAHIQFRKMIALNIDKSFDWIVTSEEAGADKSQKMPFECLQRKLKLADNSPIWMFGDTAADAAVKTVFEQAQVFACCIAAKPFKGADFAFTNYPVLHSLLLKAPAAVTTV